MLHRGTAALEIWCRRVCEGYPGVEIKNMGESWRDGLAFCAILHKYRPDLIDWQECRKGDTFRNCSLAFGIAESCLAIPSLLDPQDMVSTHQLDRLSILTYLSTMYHTLEGKNRVAFRDNSTTREKISIDSGISEDSSYSSASSGTNSPVKELQDFNESTKKNKPHLPKGNVTIHKLAVNDPDHSSSKQDSDRDFTKENAGDEALLSTRDNIQIIPALDNPAAPKAPMRPKNYSSLANRRLVKSMHELPSDVELESEEDSLFAVGFRKFSALAQSTASLRNTQPSLAQSTASLRNIQPSLAQSTYSLRNKQPSLVNAMPVICRKVFYI
jgi:hypothetical protein